MSVDICRVPRSAYVDVLLRRLVELVACWRSSSSWRKPLTVRSGCWRSCEARNAKRSSSSLERASSSAAGLRGRRSSGRRSHGAPLGAARERRPPPASRRRRAPRTAMSHGIARSLPPTSVLVGRVVDPPAPAGDLRAEDAAVLAVARSAPAARRAGRTPRRRRAGGRGPCRPRRRRRARGRRRGRSRSALRMRSGSRIAAYATPRKRLEPLGRGRALVGARVARQHDQQRPPGRSSR